MERDVKYVARYYVTELINMHEPHLSGIRRITHFVRDEVVMIFNSAVVEIWFILEKEKVTFELGYEE